MTVLCRDCFVPRNDVTVKNAGGNSQEAAFNV